MTNRIIAAGIAALFMNQAQAETRMVDVLPANRAKPVSMDDVMNSPAYKANAEQIQALAEIMLAQNGQIDDTIRADISRELHELPFHRTVDVEFGVGFPEIITACLEGHPTNPLAIEACAAVSIFGATFSANVKYRWDLVLHQTAGGHIHQLSAGPGAGLRYYEGGWGEHFREIRAEVMGSLEYVFWITKNFGLTAQLDVGASLLTWTDASSDRPRLLPYGKLTIGFAF